MLKLSASVGVATSELLRGGCGGPELSTGVLLVTVVAKFEVIILPVEILLLDEGVSIESALEELWTGVILFLAADKRVSIIKSALGEFSEISSTITGSTRRSNTLLSKPSLMSSIGINLALEGYASLEVFQSGI